MMPVNHRFLKMLNRITKRVNYLDETEKYPTVLDLVTLEQVEGDENDWEKHGTLGRELEDALGTHDATHEEMKRELFAGDVQISNEVRDVDVDHFRECASSLMNVTNYVLQDKDDDTNQFIKNDSMGNRKGRQPEQRLILTDSEQSEDDGVALDEIVAMLCDHHAPIFACQSPAKVSCISEDENSSDDVPRDELEILCCDDTSVPNSETLGSSGFRKHSKSILSKQSDISDDFSDENHYTGMTSKDRCETRRHLSSEVYANDSADKEVVEKCHNMVRNCFVALNQTVVPEWAQDYEVNDSPLAELSYYDYVNDKRRNLAYDGNHVGHNHRKPSSKKRLNDSKKSPSHNVDSHGYVVDTCTSENDYHSTTRSNKGGYLSRSSPVHIEREKKPHRKSRTNSSSVRPRKMEPDQRKPDIKIDSAPDATSDSRDNISRLHLKSLNKSYSGASDLASEKPTVYTAPYPTISPLRRITRSLTKLQKSSQKMPDADVSQSSRGKSKKRLLHPDSAALNANSLCSPVRRVSLR